MRFWSIVAKLFMLVGITVFLLGFLVRNKYPELSAVEASSLAISALLFLLTSLVMLMIHDAQSEIIKVIRSQAGMKEHSQNQRGD